MFFVLLVFRTELKLGGGWARLHILVGYVPIYTHGAFYGGAEVAVVQPFIHVAGAVEIGGGKGVGDVMDDRGFRVKTEKTYQQERYQMQFGSDPELGFKKSKLFVCC